MKQKQITHWLSVIVIGLALGFALQFVRAWTEPTTSPPNGNVGAPINTGATAQTKSGGISSGSYFAAPWIYGNISAPYIYSGGGIDAASYVSTPYICLNGDCRNAWPSGGTPTPPPPPTPPPTPTVTGYCEIIGTPTDYPAGDCPLQLGNISSSSAWGTGAVLNMGFSWYCSCSGSCCASSPCYCY